MQMEASRNADNTGFDYNPDSLRQNWVRGKLQVGSRIGRMVSRQKLSVSLFTMLKITITY
jgi:hypothetical protein